MVLPIKRPVADLEPSEVTAVVEPTVLTVIIQPAPLLATPAVVNAVLSVAVSSATKPLPTPLLGIATPVTAPLLTEVTMPIRLSPEPLVVSKNILSPAT